MPFIESLLDEFLDGEDPVIQSTKFHIGTDEYDTAYSEQVRAYMDALITYVNGKGYETRFWGSLGGNGFAGETPGQYQRHRPLLGRLSCRFGPE